MTHPLPLEHSRVPLRAPIYARYASLWSYWLMLDKTVNNRRFVIEQYGTVRDWAARLWIFFGSRDELLFKALPKIFMRAQLNIYSIQKTPVQVTGRGLWRFFAPCREFLFRRVPKIFSQRFAEYFWTRDPGIVR